MTGKRVIWINVLLVGMLLIEVSTAMDCPMLGDAPTQFDENMVWMCEQIEWWNSLLEWKMRVEESCLIEDVEVFWRSVITCPDFHDIKCVDDSLRHNEADIFNCTIVSCKGGKYSDRGIFRKIWRQHIDVYKAIMSIYTKELAHCRPRNCSDPDNATTAPTTAASTSDQSTGDGSGSTTASHFHSTATTSETATTKLITSVAQTSEPTSSSGIQTETTTQSKDADWIVFQRRKDGSVDFYRNWTEYVNGFGDKNGEFWLGLEEIHNLTKNGDTMLRIDMRERNGQYMFAEYSSFMIESASTNYTLNVSGYSGNATDAFGDPPIGGGGILNGHPFTTYDADNDQSPSSNCAETGSGAWWYNNCQYSNLNGLYHGTSRFRIMRWFHQYDKREMVMKFTEMKIRPKLPLEA